MKKLLTLGFVLLLSLCACTQETPQATPSLPLPVVTQAEITASPVPVPTPVKTPSGFSPTTGLPFSGTYQPIIVNIDNHPKARPQDGIQSADVVYEFRVEGSYTRFMAVFLTNIPDRIGPVRSTRQYFIQTAAEWNGLYAMFGGPGGTGPEALLTHLKDTPLKLVLNGMTDTHKAFFRDDFRKAPNNAYLNTKTARSVYDFVPEERPFLFNENANYQGTPANDIKIPYGSSARYQYDETTKTYLRWTQDKKHLDLQTGKQVSIKNVILQFANHGMYNDVHRKIDVIGEGKMIYCANGQAIEGTWVKKDAHSATKFLDASGQEIELAPGNTWISVLPTEYKITIK